MVDITAKLLKVGAGGVVVDHCCLLRKPQRLFPQGHRGVGDLGRQAGERHGIASVQGRLVLPESAHGLSDGGGRSALQFLANCPDGGIAAGDHQSPRSGLDVCKGHAGDAFARRSVITRRRWYHAGTIP